MMRAILPNQLETDLFDIEDISLAEQTAHEINGEIYCWKTTGTHNWLERGLSNVDVLGFVVLPRGLPDLIDMPGDDLEL